MRQARDKYDFSNRTTSIRVFANGFVIIWTWNSTATIFWCVEQHPIWKCWQMKKPVHQNEIHFLRRRISVDDFGWHVELYQRYVKSLLDAMAMTRCTSMATPGSKGQESCRNVADLTEKLDPQENREFRSGAGICQYMTNNASTWPSVRRKS